MDRTHRCLDPFIKSAFRYVGRPLGLGPPQERAELIGHRFKRRNDVDGGKSFVLEFADPSVRHISAQDRECHLTLSRDVVLPVPLGSGYVNPNAGAEQYPRRDSLAWVPF